MIPSLALTASLLSMPPQDTLDLQRVEIEAGSATYVADIGELEVLENRDKSDSRTIGLAFGRLQSTAEVPGPPVFFLPGGPGGSATDMAASPVWASFLEQGDVVLLDPRGSGRSEPELDWSSPSVDPALFFTDRETAVAHMVEACQGAAEHFASAGIDLTGYHVHSMADDIAQLCDTLGYDGIHILAHSFGTQVGQVLIRRHPDLVKRFVSVGTAGVQDTMKLPKDLDASLEYLGDQFAARAEGEIAGGEELRLEEAFAAAVESLEKEPLRVTVANPRTGAPMEVALGPFGFQFIVLADLGDTSDLPVMPRLIHSVRNRETEMVQWFLQKRVGMLSPIPGLLLTVRGASGASPGRWRQIRREARSSPFGLTRCLFSPETDEVFGVAKLGRGFHEPVETAVPTLFISGTLDANTPPSQAERVREGFENSGHLIVEQGGHEDLLPDPLVQQRILAFLGGEAPGDERIKRPALRFAPLEGPTLGFDHPSLPR